MRTYRILHLEDSPTDADLVKRQLKVAQLDFQYTLAEDRNSYILGLREFRPNVILADHSLPSIDSEEALELAKQFSSDSAFILLTGTVSEEFAVKILHAGADDYILKVSLTRLPSAVVNAFDKKKAERERELNFRRLQEAKEVLEINVHERTLELVNALDRERRLNSMKTSLLSMASHEFRTPLSTILSSVILMEKYANPNHGDQVSKHGGRIRSAVKNLTNILDDFISLDKLERGKVESAKERIDLKAFILDVIDQIEATCKPDQNIHYVHEGIALALLDKQFMRNILINLISNAIKYSAKDIELRTEATPEQVVLHVRDEGIGIPEEEQRRMFDGFFRAKNATEIQGTGLGLSIVKRYVDLLEGSITFVSKQDQGTTFTVRLPNRIVD